MDYAQYKNDALNSYPRLCRELANMTKKVCDEIGAKYSEKSGSEDLEVIWNNQKQNLGSVDRPEWTVEKDGKKLVFHPGGLTLMTFAKIDVSSSSKKIDLVKNAYFIVSSMNGDGKVLAKLNNENEAVGLDQVALSEDIKRFLQ